jgi:hypothetical protein
MKRFLSTLFFYTISIGIFAQTQYDYYDDSAVAGGADRVLNTFVIIFLIVIAFVVIIFIFGGISKIMYEFSPQKEIDKQKKEKEEREKQEKIRKEQEHQKALLALPEKTVCLSIEGRPHFVELAYHRIHTEMIAICLYSVDKILWDGTDITSQVGSTEKLFNYIYGKHYKTRWPGSGGLYELVVSKYCTDLAKKSSAITFRIEFTIRGEFNPQKLQIMHHTYDGLRDDHISRDIKCLEFVLYDGDEIQTHLVNGKPLCLPYEGYNSFPKL